MTLGLIVGADAINVAAASAETAIRPRVWTSKKDKLALIIDVDPAVVEILGWTREEMIGLRSLEFIHPEDQPRAHANWMDMLSTHGDGRRARLRHRHRDGSWIWFEYINHNLLSDPAHNCVHSEMINISDEMAALEALRSSEELLRRLAEALPLRIVQIDAAGRIIYRNKRLGTIGGNEQAATIGELLADVVPADRETLESVLHSVIHEGKNGDLEVMVSRSGEVCCCSLSLRALRSEKGRLTGAIICIGDVTERTRMRDELEFRANYDALTGCRNRASILAVLDRTIAAPPAPGCGTAVLFVDLDQFKEVNDRFGHAVGDELLRRISARLIAGVRSGDVRFETRSPRAARADPPEAAFLRRLDDAKYGAGDRLFHGAEGELRIAPLPPGQRPATASSSGKSRHRKRSSPTHACSRGTVEETVVHLAPLPHPANPPRRAKRRAASARTRSSHPRESHTSPSPRRSAAGVALAGLG